MRMRIRFRNYETAALDFHVHRIVSQSVMSLGVRWWDCYLNSISQDL